MAASDQEVGGEEEEETKINKFDNDENTKDEKKVISVVNEEEEEEEEDPNENNDDENDEEEWKDADFLSFDAGKEEEEEDTEESKNNNSNSNKRQKLNDTQQKSTRPAGVPYPNATAGGGMRRGGAGNGGAGGVISSMAQDNKQELPPWMNTYPQYMDGYHQRIPPLVMLHNEIVDFASLMMPQEEEVKQREELIERINQLAKSIFYEDDNFEMRVFGSQATGLFLPTSDIDLVLILPDEEEEEEKETHNTNNNGDNTKKKGKKKKKSKLTEEQEMESWKKNAYSGSPLDRLAQALQDQWKDELSYLEYIENTRIPIVKFTHGPTNLSVDICCNQGGGPESAELMKRFMEAMPPLRPLTFVLKYFMESRVLNEPYYGGAGSFMLQMMIVSFLQQREREEYRANRTGNMNLGALLLEFFELYGIDFNYVTTGISVRSDGFYFPKGSKDRIENFWQPTRPFSLALEHPFDITADVGRGSYRMQLIQRSFEVAFRTLLAYVSEPVQPTISILRTILPPTEEMDKRAVLQKVTRVEQALKAAGGLLDAPLTSGRGGDNNSSYHHRQSRREMDESNMSMSSEEGEEESRYSTGGGRRRKRQRR